MVVTILLTQDTHTIKYSILNTPSIPSSEHRNDTAVLDLCHVLKDSALFIKDFIYVTSFLVGEDYRNQGLGEVYLRDFCTKFNDKVILLVSGAHTDEYPIEPTEEEYKNILNRLNKFYTRVGFANVSSEIGNYTYRCTHVYRNEPGLKLLSYLDSQNTTTLFDN